jgi:hypothetical protein
VRRTLLPLQKAEASVKQCSELRLFSPESSPHRPFSDCGNEPSAKEFNKSISIAFANLKA